MTDRKSFILTPEQIHLINTWARRHLGELESERMKTVLGSAQEMAIEADQEEIRILVSVLRAS